MQLVCDGGMTTCCWMSLATWAGAIQSHSAPPNWREAEDDHQTMSWNSPLLFALAVITQA